MQDAPLVLSARNMRAASPATFFLLVLLFSAPFWVLDVASQVQLMPGMSISALMAFCPMVVALILRQREQSRGGALCLLRRSGDFRRIRSKRWYAPVLLLMPIVSVLVYVGVRGATEQKVQLSV
jgi:hypothetical protein